MSRYRTINQCEEEVTQRQKLQRKKKDPGPIAHKKLMDCIKVDSESFDPLRHDNSKTIKALIQRLEQENTNNNNEIQQLRQETFNKINEIQQLREENISMNREKQQVQQENADLRIEIQHLQETTILENFNKNEIQQLRKKKSKRRNEMYEIVNTNNEIQRLPGENLNINNEILELRRENANMSRRNQKVQKENDHLRIEIEQLSKEILGRGGWGTVYIGDFYGPKVAVKEFQEIILSPHYEEILGREIKIASQCRHPNLLQFICATENDQHHLLIVTKLMDMTLRTLLEQRAREKSGMEYQEIKSISLDVARGLNYLHSKKPSPVIHRDVSSANVLLWIENGAVRRAKVSDYGSANFMQKCNTANPGAALYAAPEASRAEHDAKVIIIKATCTE
ncbi:probable serine threonine- kinase DDB_G0271682, partial [Paramuricea clavata]